jgi:hypothetical protein
MIFAIDFDGTLCEEAFPGIGWPRKDVIRQVKAAQKAGHLITLWTCRHGNKLAQAVMWLFERGVSVDLINEDAASQIVTYGSGNRKIGADYYIDDKSPGSVEWFLRQNWKNK